MESQKNARGNSKDSAAQPKKTNPLITSFFKKQPEGQATEQTLKVTPAQDQVELRSRSSVANAQHRDSSANSQRVQSSQQQQNAIPQVDNPPSSNLRSSSRSATPMKKQQIETPKKRASSKQGAGSTHQQQPDQHQQPEVTNLEEIQSLVDKKVNMDKSVNAGMVTRNSQSALKNSRKLGQTQEDLEEQLAYEDDEGEEQYQMKRSLRPRKVENYKQMLDGDEATLKAIQDEERELRKKKNQIDDEEDEDEDEIMDECQIERASDDEEDEEYGAKNSKAKLSKKVFDEDMDDIEEQSLEEEDKEAEDELESESFTVEKSSKKRAKKQLRKQQETKKKRVKNGEKQNEGEEEEQTVFIDNLPNDEFDIRRMLKEVRRHIKVLEKQFFEEEDSEKEEELKQINNVSKHDEALEAFKETSHLKQFWCIPLSVNVMHLEFDNLAQSQMKQGGRLFDVITIDPPWQLSSANPTRGVAIAYDTLNDKEILSLQFDKIQTDGFLFIWVINAKYRLALEMMEKYNYKLVDEIAWVKQTVNGKIAKGHGYYLQHAKETCLVGVKGNVKNKARFNIESDVIFSQRRGQSQKPEEIYEIAEALVPNGYYLEIFGRRNNLHNGWVTIGNEL